MFKSYNKKCLSNGNSLIEFEKYKVIVIEIKKKIFIDKHKRNMLIYHYRVVNTLQDKINEFKDKYIYLKIFEEEIANNT